MVPSVPYLDIIRVIEREWKPLYTRLTSLPEVNTEVYQKVNEREKKWLFAGWCIKLLENEYEKCGGRWVAMVSEYSPFLTPLLNSLGSRYAVY